MENMDQTYSPTEIQECEPAFYECSIHMYDLSLAETGRCATAEQPGEDIWIGKELSDRIKG